MIQRSKNMKKPFAMSIIAAALMVAGAAQAKEVTDADILNDAKTTGDVVHFGLGQQGQRFSTLDKINTKTVKNLVPVPGWARRPNRRTSPTIPSGPNDPTTSTSASR